ncbi:MAG: NAD-dependent epimerase/dehydratase family protein [Acidimicrobiales bacterium]
MINGEAYSGERVLVTGGAGFIGSNLVRRLVDLSADVVVFDDFSNGLRSNLEDVESIEVIEADIRDSEAVFKAAEGCSKVFHLAALGSVPRSLEAPGPSYHVNLYGSVNVFEAARRAGAQNTVYASSSSVYGNTESRYKREGEEGSPISPYAASKAAMELAARTHAACYEMDILGLRFFNVFGPYQRPDAAYAAVVPLFTDALNQGRQPTIFGDGLQVRDFTYVGDVVHALLLAGAASGNPRGEALNVSSGVGQSVLDIFSAVRAAAGFSADLQPVHAPERAGDIRVSRADIGQAKVRLGFEPDWTLEDGMKKYVEWYNTRPI